MKVRIAKYLTNAGYCSRREAEKLIFSNKVIVNNEICIHPSQKVNETDVIKIDNKTIFNKNKIKLWKLHKPIKFICSTNDNLKRKTIYELIPKKLPKLISVGRLDYMSEGIILLTNDGDFSRYLELPSSNIERVYEVCIKKIIKKNEIKKINDGIKIDGIKYSKISVEIKKIQKNSTWMTFKLREGKNREIRNICSYFSWNIVKLIRVSYGPYKLGKLKSGDIQEIKIIGNDTNNSR